MQHCSPYEVALGERLKALHPQLREYFSAIPPNSTGRGSGTFDRVGTPRRWLWPLLRFFGRGGALFAVWEHSVPFEVHNHQNGTGSVSAVSAERRFGFASGAQVMTDRITAIGDGALRDELGRYSMLSADFDATVADRALLLRSTVVRVTIGGVRVRFPRALAPVIQLHERFDDDTGRQEVTLSADLPLLGRIYEYAGTFRYAVTPNNAPAGSHP